MSHLETDDQTYILEPVELDDVDDVKLEYEELPTFAEDDADNFDSIFSTLQGELTVEDAEAKQREPEHVVTGYNKSPQSDAKEIFEPSPEDMCVEDFVRNFLVAHKMQKTLEAFQIEWFELYNGKPPSTSKDSLPRIYQQYQDLLQEMDILKRTSAAAAAAATEAKGTWAKFRHERDVHRLHHRRLVQEKNALVTDLKRLRRHVRQYQPALDELQKKYEQSTKELVLVRLEKSKLQQSLAALQTQYQQATGEAAPGTANNSHGTGPSIASVAASLRNFSNRNQNDKRRVSEKTSTTPRSLDKTARTMSVSMPEAKEAPTNYSHLLPIDSSNDGRRSKPVSLTTAVMAHSFQAHKLGISGVAISPKSPIFATTSDDMTWKLWSLPRGELIMTGKGSNSWFAGGAFHPSGSLFATAGADGHAKIWNLAEQRCISQLSGHTQPLWDIKFHEGQHTVLTASGDQTARLWDIHTSQLLHTFRGHVDAVNRVEWVPHTATFVTASGDKTVSLWDARTGLCVQTFFGHNSAVRALDITSDGQYIASGDARGQIRIWDLSNGSEYRTFETDNSKNSTSGALNIAAGVNSISFDASCQSFAAAIDSGQIRVYQREFNEMESTLSDYEYAGEMQGQGAESIVQDLVISRNSDYSIAGTGDGNVLIWQL